MEISNSFGGINRAINVIKNTLPPESRAMIDASMADKTGSVAKNFGSLNQNN